MPTIEINLAADQSVRFEGNRIVITDQAVNDTPEMRLDIETQPLVSRPSKRRKTRKTRRPTLALVT